MKIELTKGYTSKVDPQDYLRINAHSWHVDFRKKVPYARSRIKGKLIYLHRFILNLNSKDPEIDHINNDSLDNRRENLRLSNRNQNNLNKKKKGTGIYFNGYSWVAQIQRQGKAKYLGSFPDKKHALQARKEAENAYNGC